MKKRLFMLTAVCLIIALTSSDGLITTYGKDTVINTTAKTNEWFPFTIPWDDSSDNAVNAGKLVLDAPAGKHGFLKVRDGHFYFEDGTRIRFWGTNLSAGANFPTHEVADKVADHMAKFGFNIVRLHHMDTGFAPKGIFDKSAGNTQILDAEQLDRLDYLIAQFKKRGIYVDINLHVSRKFTDGDGIVEAKNLPRNSKQVTLFDQKLINLEKDYANKLLNHYNPYTGSYYNNEPGVALVETTNENSMYTAWVNGALFGKTDEALPEYYRSELDDMFNQWLKNKYTDTQALKTAWSTEEKAEGENLAINGDFNKTLENGWVREVHSGRKADFNSENGYANINITQPGDTQSDIQFKQLGIKLEKGKNYTLRFSAKADNSQNISVSFGMEKSPWKNYGLSGKAALTNQWTQYSFNFTANTTTDENTRLSFSLGTASGKIYIDNVSLTETGIIGLADKESLEKHNISRTPWADRFAYTPKRIEDNTEFYYSIEKDFFEDMNSFIHNNLGIKVPVSTSNNYNGQPDLAAQNEGDYIDAHGYWDHPSFPGTRFDKKNFKQTNLSLVSSNNFIYNPSAAFNSSPVIRYSMSAVSDKPLVISEWNDVFPNDYDYEEAGIVMSYSLLQDWDGLFIFNYHSSQDDWDSGKVDSWFEVSNNPGKMSQMPACAIAFIKGYFNKAQSTLSLNYSWKDILSKFTKKAGSVDYNLEGDLPGFMPYIHQIRKSSFNADKTTKVSDLVSDADLEKLSKQQVLKSDTSEICWDNSEKGKEFVTFNSSKFQGASGFLSGKSIKLQDLELENISDSSVFITALDNKDINKSEKMLLTAVSSQKNTGELKDDKNGLVSWGEAPVLLKPVYGVVKIKLPSSGKNFKVYALDSRGNRREPINTKVQDGFLEFFIGNNSTLWYEITQK